MDDKYFFAVLIYLFVSSAVAGFLPSGFYTGTSHEGLSDEDLRDTVETYKADVGDVSGQLNFFQKVLTFLFVTWVIDGIPLLLSFVILFFNIVTVLVIGIYVYDKIRGIGS